SRVPLDRFSKDHTVAVSHHDATPLTGDNSIHHLRRRNRAEGPEVAAARRLLDAAKDARFAFLAESIRAGRVRCVTRQTREWGVICSADLRVVWRTDRKYLGDVVAVRAGVGDRVTGASAHQCLTQWTVPGHGFDKVRCFFGDDHHLHCLDAAVTEANGHLGA